MRASAIRLVPLLGVGGASPWLILKFSCVGLCAMRIRQHIPSLLPAGSLVLLLLLPTRGCAADDAYKPQSKVSFGDVIERQLPAPSYIAPNQVLLPVQHTTTNS